MAMAGKARTGRRRGSADWRIGGKRGGARSCTRRERRRLQNRAKAGAGCRRENGNGRQKRARAGGRASGGRAKIESRRLMPFMADGRHGGQARPDRQIDGGGAIQRGDSQPEDAVSSGKGGLHGAAPDRATPESGALAGGAPDCPTLSGAAPESAMPEAAAPAGSACPARPSPPGASQPEDAPPRGAGATAGDMFLPLLCAALLLAFPLYFIFADAPGFLENEKRYASALPDFTADNALSGAWSEGAESWLADKMPLRSFWVGLNAYFAYATGRQNATDVYIDSRGDLLEKPAAFDAAELGKRLGKIADFAGAANARTAVLAVPSAGYAAKPYLPGYVWSGYNDEALFAQISAAFGQEPAQPRPPSPQAQGSPGAAPSAETAPGAGAGTGADAAAGAALSAEAGADAAAGAAANTETGADAAAGSAQGAGAAAGFIDVRAEFLGSGTPLFFRTDHHWNMDGAYMAYTAICRYWGMEPFERGRFGVARHDGFYGSTYSTSGLWLTKADTIELWQPPEQVSVTFSDKEGASGSLFFESHLAAMDKYPVFLDGNHPLATVENMTPSAEARAAGTLLMIKDSYANSLVPLLIGHYSKIVLIDLRYYRQSASEVAAAQSAAAPGADAPAASSLGADAPATSASATDADTPATSSPSAGKSSLGAGGNALDADENAPAALDILFVYSAKNLASDTDLLWLR
jgi:hypothetical protein